jgi:hypothetical protein
MSVVKRMRDDELLMLEGHLEHLLYIEVDKVLSACDDPMTQHYGVEDMVADIVGRKARRLENELEALCVEIEWRALRAWPREPEGERQHRREKFLHPALRRDGYFGDRWCERLERLAR